jgi:hypothetical protein
VFFRGTAGVDAGLEFIEEAAGNPTGMGRGGMNGDRDGVIDRAFEFGQVRDHGLKRIEAEGLPDLVQVRQLERSSLLELRDHVAQELQLRVVVLLHTLNRGADGGRPPGSPVGRFKGDDDEMGRAQGGVAGQGNPRRAIEQHVVVLRGQFDEHIGKCGMQPLRLPLLRL